MSKKRDDYQDRLEQAKLKFFKEGCSMAQISKQFKVNYDTLKRHIKKAKHAKDLKAENPAVTKEAKKRGFDASRALLAWDKTEERSTLYRLHPFTDSGISDFADAFRDIAADYNKGYKKRKIKPVKSTQKQAIRLIISDVHVGMKSDGSDALFNYLYNADVFRDKMQEVHQALSETAYENGPSEVAYLDNLGDYQDGYAKQTERGGHELDQNMTEAEVFRVCVEEKLELVTRILEEGIAKKVVLRTVLNDNHAAKFAAVVHEGVKMQASLMFKEDVVEVDGLQRFIEHRAYGDHCFLLTHGKDGKHMTRGLPINLNDKAVDFINLYIRKHKLDQKYKWIHLDKGDLHRTSYQKHKFFSYRNFCSLAPPSKWVQHNFGDTYSGFSIQVIKAHHQAIMHKDYDLEYDLVK